MEISALPSAAALITKLAWADAGLGMNLLQTMSAAFVEVMRALTMGEYSKASSKSTCFKRNSQQHLPEQELR